MPGWWRIEEDDDRFVREARDVWVYGPADPRLAGLRVPAARDVTLGEAAPPDIDGLARRPGGYVFFRESVVAREPALSWVDRPRPLAVGGYLGVPVEEWRPREGRVVGMQAPELGEGCERELAIAEREVRAWRRARNQAARRRDALVAHARHVLGVPGSDLARWVGVTRNRIQQISDEVPPASGGDAPATVADAAAAVRAAHQEFAQADEMLHRAEALRRRRVAHACDTEGFSLGTVAKILGVSRPRAQQLRDVGREDAAAA
jgi:hypothetical protein